MPHFLKIFTKGVPSQANPIIEVEVYPNPASDGNNMYKFERTDGKQIITNMDFIVEEIPEEE